MRILYFECSMGAAGDMLCASLYELLGEDDRSVFIDKLNSLALPGVTVSSDRVKRGGMAGTRISVAVYGEGEAEFKANESLNKRHEHEHEHKHVHAHEHEHEHKQEHEHFHAAPGDIYRLIDSLDVSDYVKTSAKSVYRLIAEAEAMAHGTETGLVHFHEVGALDAVADVVGFCMLIEMLCVDNVTSSPVVTGFGSVRTAHGVLPVPAPATAALLTGIPTRAGQVEGELCTPTGAALLKHFCSAFGPRPLMTVKAVGYGMGTKDFKDRPNCVRAFLGETAESSKETICELRCNVDDMTPEAAAFACERIIDAGARDVYLQQVIMKKGRPGFVFVCLCDEKDEKMFSQLLLKHTTTLGVRRFECVREVLRREIAEIETVAGKMRIKCSGGNGVSRLKPEYEDVAKIARERDISFMEAERLTRE